MWKFPAVQENKVFSYRPQAMPVPLHYAYFKRYSSTLNFRLSVTPYELNDVFPTSTEVPPDGRSDSSPSAHTHTHTHTRAQQSNIHLQYFHWLIQLSTHKVPCVYFTRFHIHLRHVAIFCWYNLSTEHPLLNLSQYHYVKDNENQVEINQRRFIRSHILPNTLLTTSTTR
jgi:hypothetical protein